MLIFATGCGGSDGAAAPPTTAVTSTTVTPTEPPTTTTAAPETTLATTVAELTDEEQILAVIQRYWDVLTEGNNPPDPEYPGWAEVAAGEKLVGLRERAAQNLEAGTGSRPGSSEPRARRLEISTVDSEKAVVDVCLRDDGILYDLDSGAVLNDDVIYLWYQAVVELVDSAWRVTRTMKIQELGGVESCDSAF